MITDEIWAVIEPLLPAVLGDVDWVETAPNYHAGITLAAALIWLRTT